MKEPIDDLLSQIREEEVPSLHPSFERRFRERLKTDAQGPWVSVIRPAAWALALGSLAVGLLTRPSLIQDPLLLWQNHRALLRSALSQAEEDALRRKADEKSRDLLDQIL